MLEDGEARSNGPFSLLLPSSALSLSFFLLIFLSRGRGRQRGRGREKERKKEWGGEESRYRGVVGCVELPAEIEREMEREHSKRERD